MDAIQLLLHEHRDAMMTINQLEATANEPTAGDVLVFERLKNDLQLHKKLEEVFFYPALEYFDETTSLVVNSYGQHQQIEMLLAGMDPRNSNWGHQITQLKQELEHHLAEEEQEMFAKAQFVLGDERLEALRREMEELKRGRLARA